MRSQRRSQGFTIIELLVVIGIIVLLVGLTVAVSTSVVRGSEVSRTEDALKLIDMAVTEWEAAAERKLSWGTDDDPVPGSLYDIKQDAASVNDHMPQMLARIGNTDETRDILTQIAGSIFKRDDATGRQWMQDPWDNEILMIHPGRVASFDIFGDVLTDADPDGTVRTEHETRYGIATNRRVLFVSAGPDGSFGSVDPGATDLEKADAADNIYSYAIEGAPTP